MNYTLMIPTRKRQHMLRDLLQSIYSTATHPELVETIVTYDNDDQSTKDAIFSIQEQYKDFPVYFYSRDRHYATSGVYYNDMAKQATGKYVIAINDDTRFIKCGWDVEGMNKIEKYLEDKPDRIMYGITEDREIERKRNEYNYFSCFPLLTKETIRVMGFFFDPIFHKDGADWDLACNYRTINRMLDLREEIIIEHLSFRSGRREKDLLDADEMPVPSSGADAGHNLHRNTIYLREYIDNFEKIYRDDPNAIFRHCTRTW